MSKLIPRFYLKNLPFFYLVRSCILPGLVDREIVMPIDIPNIPKSHISSKIGIFLEDLVFSAYFETLGFKVFSKYAIDGAGKVYTNEYHFVEMFVSSPTTLLGKSKNKMRWNPSP